MDTHFTPTRKGSLKYGRLSSPGEESSGNKRQRIYYSDHELNDYFFKSMENRLKSSIRTVIRKNTSKLNEDLDALKQKPPPGIITEASKLANVNQNEGDLVLKQMRAFMTNRVGKKNEIE
jgi:hypothetical protein